MSKAKDKRIRKLETSLRAMLELMWDNGAIDWQTGVKIEDDACRLLGIPCAAERHAAYAKLMGWDQ